MLSRAALPASSSTSAARYSSTAARYTGAPAPTREAYLPAFRKRAMRPMGNCRPALALRLTAFLAVFPFPRPDILREVKRGVERERSVPERASGV